MESHTDRPTPHTPLHCCAGKATPFSVVYAWLLAKVGRKLDAPAGEAEHLQLRWLGAPHAQSTAQHHTAPTAAATCRRGVSGGAAGGESAGRQIRARWARPVP